MKESPVTNEFRIVQVFLPLNNNRSPEIYEVSSNEVNLRCTCHMFYSRNRCKHIDFVQAKIDANGGKTYPLEISIRATKEDAEKATASVESFREFVIKFGRVEVI